MDQLIVSFLANLIRTTLRGTAFPHVERAVSLLLGVSATESGLRNIQQYGGGPARGIFQIEPVTAEDMHRCVVSDPTLSPILTERCQVETYSLTALEQNMVYQLVLARVLFYVRDPQPLPKVLDVEEAASRYKTYYNTAAGSGSVEKYLADYERLIAPHYPPTRRRT